MQFAEINHKIAEVIRQAKNTGGMKQEIRVLQAIKKEFMTSGRNRSAGKTPMTAEFFKLNERKLEALIEATMHDMEKAKTKVLRMANDQYRKVILNAQVYANTGIGTYEKAVDMATRNMLEAGLNCVEYKNEVRHTLSDYADMAIRTASKRAYLAGEGEKRQEWGISTVIMNKRGNPCPKCLPFCGKVLIDDVWSGGKPDGKHYLMSKAIEKGLYHPRCKDSHTTYFPGISTAPDDTYTEEEIEKVKTDYEADQKRQYADRQVEKFGRLAMYSLDPENKKRYGVKVKEWNHVRFRTGDMETREYAESKHPLANFHAVPQDNVVNTLRLDAEEWIEVLTDKEKHAIRKYTYNSGDKKSNRFFERLNAMLRGDLPEDDKLRGYADTISGALKKNKLKYDVMCYRSLDIDLYSDLDVGDFIEEGQFISTSIVKSAALDKPYKVTIYAPKGSKAAYIENVSKYPKQRELLLDRESKFRVISKKGNEIELEVIV